MKSKFPIPFLIIISVGVYCGCKKTPPTVHQQPDQTLRYVDTSHRDVDTISGKYHVSGYYKFNDGSTIHTVPVTTDTITVLRYNDTLLAVTSVAAGVQYADVSYGGIFCIGLAHCFSGYHSGLGTDATESVIMLPLGAADSIYAKFALYTGANGSDEKDYYLAGTKIH